ncbi:MAG: hypothetical protein ACRCXC_01260 [Legionella sp.]
MTTTLAGVIDGINPYIGTLALGTISPPMLVLVTAFCITYFWTTLIIRIHDEMQLQRQLSIAEKKVELVLLEKEIDFLTHT